MIGKINKFFLCVINFPIYCFSLLVPRKSNIWVFGAWFGEKYSDNSKYLFEYVNQHHNNIQCIWLSRDRDTVSQLKIRGYESYYTYSLRAYWLSLRAKVGVVTTGFRDINPYLLKDMTIAQLWHGTPLKKIMHDDKIYFKEPNKIIRIMFPFIRHETNHGNQMFIAASEEVQKKISSAFRVNSEHVAITGYPRTDIFFSEKKEEYPVKKRLIKLKQTGHKIGMYMPTHRNAGKTDITQKLFINIEQLNQFLREKKIILCVKLHYYHTKESISRKAHSEFTNLFFIDDHAINHDIYALLPETDFLVTDYSSVFFDYLLLNKPIIFTPFDYQEYLQNDRELYYAYDSVTPGPKAYDWAETMNFIEDAVNSPETFEKEREKVSSIFCAHRDGQNSKRVYEAIIDRLS